MNEEIKSYVFKILMSATKERPITAQQIALTVKDTFNKNFTTVHVRKVVNQFRREELPVLASFYGYWISYEKEDIIEQIVSMKTRILAQEQAIHGLQNLIKTL